MIPSSCFASFFSLHMSSIVNIVRLKLFWFSTLPLSRVICAPVTKPWLLNWHRISTARRWRCRDSVATSSEASFTFGTLRTRTSPVSPPQSAQKRVGDRDTQRRASNSFANADPAPVKLRAHSWLRQGGRRRMCGIAYQFPALRHLVFALSATQSLTSPQLAYMHAPRPLAGPARLTHRPIRTRASWWGNMGFAIFARPSQTLSRTHSATDPSMQCPVSAVTVLMASVKLQWPRR